MPDRHDARSTVISIGRRATVALHYSLRCAGMAGTHVSGLTPGGGSIDVRLVGGRACRSLATGLSGGSVLSEVRRDGLGWGVSDSYLDWNPYSNCY